MSPQRATAPLHDSAGSPTNQPVNPSRGAARLVALDFTKGALVLVMVLYHWLNYFVSADGAYYRYLRFLTPSFIFITGFLIVYAYAGKSNRDRRKVSGRLASRGCRLIVLFVVLNAVMALLTSPVRVSIIGDWTVYLGERGEAGRAAFSILLPIAYLLMLSAVVWRWLRQPTVAFRIIAPAGICLVLVCQALGANSAFLELISIGLIGAALGTVSVTSLARVYRYRLAIAIVYCAYLFAITFAGERYLLQVCGAALSVSLIYVVGLAATDELAVPCVVLGRYSLVGYIVQIGVLQVLLRLAPGIARGYIGTKLAVLALAVILTFALVIAVDRARARVPLVHRLYAAVFA